MFTKELFDFLLVAGNDGDGFHNAFKLSLAFMCFSTRKSPPD